MPILGILLGKCKFHSLFISKKLLNFELHSSCLLQVLRHSSLNKKGENFEAELFRKLVNTIFSKSDSSSFNLYHDHDVQRKDLEKIHQLLNPITIKPN